MAAKTKICWDCKTRPVSKTVIGPDLCETCLEYADHENMHQSDDHENGEEQDGFQISNCMVCHPELDDRYTPRKTGHTNTVAKSRTSHAGCDHECSPKARAACRKARAAK